MTDATADYIQGARRVPIPRELLEQYPDLYAAEVDGDCMEPEIVRGDVLLVSPSEEPQDGDLVLVHFTNPAKQPVVKRLARRPWLWEVAPGSQIMPVAVLEQDNPPKRYTIPVDHIRAADKVIGTSDEAPA